MMFDETLTTTGHDAEARRVRALPPADARAEVSKTIEHYLAEAVSWRLAGAAGEPPILALRVTAGTGKTRTALERLGRIAPSLLLQGPVIYYAPTLDLAREACATFGELAPHVPASVVAGRRAIVDGAPLCRRIDELTGLGAMVPSIQEAVCKRHDGRRMIFADCYRACRYQAQFDHDRTEVVFTSHAYLRWPLPVHGTVSLRIIDEACWPTLNGSQLLTLDAWLSGPTRPSVAEQWQGHWVKAHADRIGAARRLQSTGEPLVYDYGRIARIGEARSLVADALRQGSSPIRALRDAGFDADGIEHFREWELRDLPEARIRPKQAPDTQAAIMRNFDAGPRRGALLRARVWEMIGETFDREDTGRLSWATLAPCPDTGQPRHAIGLHFRNELPLDAPILMIDADLDPLIIQAYAPTARFVRIDAQQTAEVIQVSDRTMSATWLLDPANGRTRRDLVRAVIAEEVAPGTGPVLLVATKSVLRTLHQDIDPDGDYSSDEALRQPIAGARPAWFGPNMRGINSYRDWSRMIVLGRHEPPMHEVERAARAIFGVNPGGGEGGRNVIRSSYTMADGSERVAEIRGLPYPEGQSVLSQMREVLTNQAIARLRLVDPAGPKRVLLLCKLPIPDLPVTTLSPWDDLSCPRLRAAIAAAPDVEPGVQRLRLSAKGLHQDAPSVFPTVDAAKAWRREKTTERLLGMISRVATGLGLDVSPFYEPGQNGGRNTPGVLLMPRSAGK